MGTESEYIKSIPDPSRWAVVGSSLRSIVNAMADILECDPDLELVDVFAAFPLPFSPSGTGAEREFFIKVARLMHDFRETMRIMDEGKGGS